MDEPKETLSDESRISRQELSHLNECQSMIRETRTHIEKCTKLNYKAVKYGSELRLFASVDYYLQARDCLKKTDNEIKEYDNKCAKFHK